MSYYLNLIFFQRRYFLVFKLILDRLLFKLIYEKVYKNRFNNYGENIKWGRDQLWCLIPKNVRISNPNKISIMDNCSFDENVYLQAHHESEGLFIGQNVRINSNTHIQSFSKIEIYNNVLIAPFCHINSGNHGFDNSTLPIMNQEYQKSGEIHIGSGSWLGHSATILGNVTLGSNTVVGSGAIVTKSFKEIQSILVGIPAKNIKK